jgi:hypothetical protein
LSFNEFAFSLAIGPEAVELPLAMPAVFASAEIFDVLFERLRIG